MRKEFPSPSHTGLMVVIVNREPSRWLGEAGSVSSNMTTYFTTEHAVYETKFYSLFYITVHKHFFPQIKILNTI